MFSTTLVIATPIGNAGVRAEDGRSIVLAETPEEFRRAMANAVADPERRETLAAAGREYAEKRFDWDSIASELLAVLSE